MTEIYYTFIYCMMHDDGFVIKGNFPYVPEGYTMLHSNQCESCDWYNMGLIKYNGSDFDVIEKVRVDYDRYAGGFLFIGYMNTMTDENGNRQEDELLDKWIENVSENEKHITFVE
jgi:hypothetical protein